MKQDINSKTSLRETVTTKSGHGDEAIPRLQRAHAVAWGLLHATVGLALLFAMTVLE